MASKQPRFTRKVFECWAHELSQDAKLCACCGVPTLYRRERIAKAIALPHERAIRVRVTVERIAAKKPKGKS